MKSQTKGGIKEDTTCLTFILVSYQFSICVLSSSPNFLYNSKIMHTCMFAASYLWNVNQWVQSNGPHSQLPKEQKTDLSKGHVPRLVRVKGMVPVSKINGWRSHLLQEHANDLSADKHTVEGACLQVFLFNSENMVLLVTIMLLFWFTFPPWEIQISWCLYIKLSKLPGSTQATEPWMSHQC